MSAAVSDSVFLGAYWGDRPESAERCASRLRRMIGALEAIDPVFTGWLAARTQAPLPGSLAAVTELMLADREHRADGGIVPDAGCSLAARSGSDEMGASLLVRCAGYSGIPGLYNAVVLEPRPGNQAEDVWLRAASEIARAVIEAWEPDWAVLGPPSYRAAQPGRDGLPHVSALTYLSDELGPLPPLPGDVHATRLDGGQLLSLLDGDRLPEIERVLRLALALEGGAHGVSGDRERAALLLDVINVDQSEASLRYREQVTGVARSRAYRVRDVDFAGYEGGTLIATVGPGHSRLLGDEIARDCLRARLLDEADRQAWAAGPAQPIEWRVAELDVAAAVEQLLTDGGYGSAIRAQASPGSRPASLDGLFLGAYWGDRWESHEACAARLRHTIEGLEAIDPMFRHWRLLRPGRLPVPMPREPALLPDLVLGGRRRDAGGAVIPELGYALAAASGLGLSAHLHLRCAQAAGTPGVLNSLLLEPFRQGKGDDIWLRQSEAIVRAVASAWSPDWVVLGPRSFRAAQPARDREPVVAAVTYLADWLGLREVPKDVRATRLAQGTLLSLVERDQLPELGRVVRAAQALRAGGLDRPVPQVQAHPVR